MEERVGFVSDGFKLAGILHLPDAGPARRAAFLVLHGFGSNKDGGGGMTVAKMLAGLGYAALRFDFRGCGESEGERGRVICKEQVKDTRNALSFLATRPEI
ncbi:MAG TPA: alpha/beta hydrolase, partial [Burkholderiales bacterium]|nr:alpha/beta hydrolase [Burkholderiales bacterium]